MQHLGELQPGGAMARRLLQQLAVSPLRLQPGAGFLQCPGRAEQLLQFRRRTEDGRTGGGRAGGGGASCGGDGIAPFAPFAEIGPLHCTPGRVADIAATGVHQRQGPGAEVQARTPGRTTEIQVVIVKGKARIKAQT